VSLTNLVKSTPSLPLSIESLGSSLVSLLSCSSYSTYKIINPLLSSPPHSFQFSTKLPLSSLRLSPSLPVKSLFLCLFNQVITTSYLLSGFRRVKRPAIYLWGWAEASNLLVSLDIPPRILISKKITGIIAIAATIHGSLTLLWKRTHQQRCLD
jgi:hypothetical protein